MKKCSYCAEEIQEEAVKCRYCGSDLADSVEAPVVQGKGRRRSVDRRTLAVSAAVAVLLIGGGVAAALALLGSSASPTGRDVAHRPPPVALSRQGLADYTMAKCVYDETVGGTEVSNSLQDCTQSMSTVIGYGSPYFAEAEQEGTYEMSCILNKGIIGCAPSRTKYKNR